MKKVIGIFLVMVFAFVFTNMALADNPKGFEIYEVRDMVDDWAKAQGYYESHNGVLEDGVFGATGVLDAADYKEITGEDFTMENFERFYHNIHEYYDEADWDIIESEVKLVGFIEGYNVYKLNISANNSLGTYCGVDYYNIEVIFMVCE